MKKSYSALSTVSVLSIVVGYINLSFGFIIALVLFVSNAYIESPALRIIVPVGVILASLLLALPFWAIGQFIKLCINVAEDINTMNENTFFIADLFAKTVNDNSLSPIEGSDEA